MFFSRIYGFFSGIFRYFFPRKIYRAGENVKIYPQAKITNMRGDKDAISIGSSSHILGQLLVFAHGGKIHIGNDCYIGEGTRIWSGESIVIGNRVQISHGVNIFDTQTHSLSARKRFEHAQHIFSKGHPSEISLGERPVVIEDDAWIACMSIILRGVHIGRGAIVAAGSVVTKDVPAWTLVAGNPARVVKTIPEEP